MSYLHDDVIAMLVDSPDFAKAVEKNLDETGTWANSVTDVVDGSLTDVIHAVLEAL